MAHPKITEDKLNDVRKRIEAGETVTAIAKDMGYTREGLSRALNRKEQPKPKVVRQEKREVPVEELSVVNQLEGKLHVANDENRVLKAQLKQAQTQSVTLKMLADELKRLVQPIPPYNEMWKKRSRGKVKESCALHLSDGHHDAVILPHRCQGLERHDFNIAMARGEHLVDTVLDWTQTHMTFHEFQTLWVLAYGDHTSGEIHGNVKHTHFGNMMRNCLAIGQFHAQMYRDLAQWFPEIKVLYLSGNHGRRKEVRKKDYQAAWDSWDYLIAETAASYCADLWNVEFLIPDAFSAVVNIEGFNLHCFHGDDIRGWAGVPWYGIERKTRRLTALNAAYDRKVHYYCLGHFHAAATQAALKGETVINGAWPACDPYTFNALDGCNEPMQIFHGVHESQGISWRLPIKLKRPEEAEGPKRYRVSLAAPEGHRK